MDDLNLTAQEKSKTVTRLTLAKKDGAWCNLLTMESVCQAFT